jgi:hypothetical protein
VRGARHYRGAHAALVLMHAAELWNLTHVAHQDTGGVGVKVVEAVLEVISLLAVSTWCAANLWFINETTVGMVSPQPSKRAATLCTTNKL